MSVVIGGLYVVQSNPAARRGKLWYVRSVIDGADPCEELIGSGIWESRADALDMDSIFPCDYVSDGDLLFVLETGRGAFQALATTKTGPLLGWICVFFDRP